MSNSKTKAEIIEWANRFLDDSDRYILVNISLADLNYERESNDLRTLNAEQFDDAAGILDGSEWFWNSINEHLNDAADYALNASDN